MNLAPIHVFCLLYEQTGEERYLRMAREIERDCETPPAGDYVRTALAGLDFYQTPKPRWESLHDIQGIAELYLITGDEQLPPGVRAHLVEHPRGDRHNTGGFSSGEQATGNPYDPGAIETCCTVAWMALSIDMLRLTGAAAVADELELSTLNGAARRADPDRALVDLQHADGRRPQGLGPRHRLPGARGQPRAELLLGERSARPRACSPTGR